MAEVKRLLGTTRLLTLIGSGGCGKTRLALQVGNDLFDRYPDGLWFVDLAPLADPAFVPNSIAAAIGILEQPTRPLTDTLADYLRTRTLLLVLDVDGTSEEDPSPSPDSPCDVGLEPRPVDTA